MDFSDITSYVPLFFACFAGGWALGAVAGGIVSSVMSLGKNLSNL